ncbi:hypothetical protein [Dokdonella sp.]|uniref:hypothetical protein n=1 Tax=Dokdonella sp. TaxID=2291710 RepID=UPI002607D138|nr:hypothetical protein [Dokdonella sp.]
MRIVVAALLAAIVLFVWQFVSHMLLPVGEMGFRAPQNEDAVLAVVGSGLGSPGIYHLPHIDSAKMGDEAAVKAWAEKAKANPYAFVVVAPPIQDASGMGRQLGTQFVTNFLAALIAAWLLAATTWRFGARVIGALGIGLFGWLANLVPQWNWYLFPRDFVVGGLIDQGVGWLLAGIAMAWWLGRRHPRF